MEYYYLVWYNTLEDEYLVLIKWYTTKRMILIKRGDNDDEERRVPLRNIMYYILRRRHPSDRTPLGLNLARVRRVGHAKSKLAVSSTLKRYTHNPIHRRRRSGIALCAIPCLNVGSGELVIINWFKVYQLILYWIAYINISVTDDLVCSESHYHMSIDVK